jgi:5-methyltetrahydrofolate--homocysteine methyltransferase
MSRTAIVDHKPRLDALASAVAEGNRDSAVTVTRALLDEGVNSASILDAGLIAGIKQVGERFRDSQCFVPEVLLAARTMRACLQMLHPQFARGKIRHRGTIVLGTVHGDLHDIGKNLVGIMLEGAGFRVIDLGVDVPTQKFAEAARQHNAHIVAISALLTTTMQNVTAVIDSLVSHGLRESVKVIVGGAPTTREWADQIGADGYAPDAIQAAEKCAEWVRSESWA